MGSIIPEEITLERERLAWKWRTQEGWTQARIAEKLGITQSAVSYMLARISKRVLVELDEMAVEAKVTQVHLLGKIIDESLQAWERSKQAIKTLNRTVVKKPVEAGGKGADGSPITEETVTTSQGARGSSGDSRFLAEARAAMADIRKILDIEPDRRMIIRWQDTLPEGFDPSEVERQFTELIALGALPAAHPELIEGQDDNDD